MVLCTCNMCGLGATALRTLPGVSDGRVLPQERLPVGLLTYGHTEARNTQNKPSGKSPNEDDEARQEAHSNPRSPAP